MVEPNVPHQIPAIGTLPDVVDKHRGTKFLMLWPAIRRLSAYKNRSTGIRTASVHSMAKG